MSKEALRPDRTTPADIGVSLRRITPADIAASYPPYPRDWYIDSSAREIRQHELKLEEQERIAKEQGLELSEEERAAKEQSLARIAELEALLIGSPPKLV